MRCLAWIFLVAILLSRTVVSALASTSPSVIDMSDAADAAEPTTTRAQDAAPVRAEQQPSANPLWSIPLKQLSNTRERPIFSPSRRPPRPAVAAAPPVVAPPMQKPKEPDRPQLSLLGTIVNGYDGFGIFMDQATNAPVRIRIGAAYRGWTLRTIQAGSVALEKDDLSVVLTFPKPATDPKTDTAHRVPAINANLFAPLAGSGGQPPTPTVLPLPSTVMPIGNPFKRDR